MLSHFHDYDSRWERGEAYWKRYAERSDSPLAATIRQAFGLQRYHDPRRSCKATKRYADKRQKRRDK